MKPRYQNATSNALRRALATAEQNGSMAAVQATISSMITTDGLCNYLPQHYFSPHTVFKLDPLYYRRMPPGRRDFPEPWIFDASCSLRLQYILRVQTNPTLRQLHLQFDGLKHVQGCEELGLGHPCRVEICPPILVQFN